MAIGGGIVRGSIDLGLDAASGVPPGLLRDRDLALTAALALALGFRTGPAQVARDEESDEEVGQGSEVEDVEPDSKSLAGCDDGRHNVGFVDGFLGGGCELGSRVSF